LKKSKQSPWDLWDTIEQINAKYYESKGKRGKKGEYLRDCIKKQWPGTPQI
jgi:hypothetical protein